MSTPQESDSLSVFPERAASASSPIIVAMLYNRNGMATWCWEAAHALHELGRSVFLIAAPDALLPGSPEVEVIRIDIKGQPAPHGGRVARAFFAARSHFAAGPDGSLEKIHTDLEARGIKPAAYLLNQSTFVDRRVPCPQFVAAWSYPVDLFSYLRKIPTLVPDRGFKEFLRTALSSIGWWRKDWRGYRSADRVLCVTKALLQSLRGRSIPSDLAYPGTCVGPVPDRTGAGIILLMAAGSLAEPRKRILWMLEAMKELRPPSGTVLQLAGEPDDSVRDAAAQIGFPVDFLGHLKRQELQQIMQKAHIFCFGSLLDDWGYVLVEAIANGLVPVAPATCPFDEILDGVGSCYSQQSQRDFIRALRSVITSSLNEQGHQAWDRAQALFSRQAFGRSLLASLETVTRPR